MLLAVFLAILNLFKLWLARFLPLLGDEAYYNIWSTRPALSYADHPPMIAWLHGLANLLSGQSELGVRLMAIALILFSTWLVYLVAREAFGRQTAAASAVLFNLVPTYLAGGLFLTPEQPLIIGWLLALLAAVRLLKSGDAKYWYWMGLAGGLGFLSKYPMLLWLPGIILFLALSPEDRYWFRRKEPYQAALIALLVASPVLLWNLLNHFPALAHHGARLGSPHYLVNLATFLALQLLMFSPPLFIFTLAGFLTFFRKEQDRFSLLFITTALPAFLAFLLISPLTLVGGHWTSTVYLGMLILLAHRWLGLYPKPFRSRRLWAYLAVILAINALALGYYAFLYPVPQELRGKAYQVNRELPAYLKSLKVDQVYSNQMGVASLVAFYGRTEVYLPRGAWKQFDLWGRPPLQPGGDIVYFVFADHDKKVQLEPFFKKIEVDPRKRLFTKDSDISSRTEIVICRGYRGGELP